MLWTAMLFFGYQIFFGNKGAPETRTADEVWTAMIEMNAKGQDVQIAKILPAYIRLLDNNVKANTITKDDKDSKTFDARLLAADTQYKSGLYQYELNNGDKGYTKIEKAYRLLQGQFRKYGQSEWWERPLTVTPDSRMLATSVTAASLYDRIIEDMSERNKTKLVVGVVPGYDIIDWLVRLTGSKPGLSYWLVGLLLAIIVRLSIWPLFSKQIMHGRRMSLLGPLVKEIKEKYKNKETGQTTDAQAMNQEMMALYKEYGLNPFAGCWPIFIQMPYFLLIYACMRLYQFEFTKGSFLWINENAGSFLGIPIAPNLGERDYLLIGLYMVSMVASTLLQPINDPSNARQQRMIGLGMSVAFPIMMLFYPLASAFIVYWLFTNMMAVGQSLYLYRLPVPPLEKVQTVHGGIQPESSNSSAKKHIDVAPGFIRKTGKKHSKKKK